MLKKPEGLPAYLRDGIGDTLRKKWEKLPSERRALLMLLARLQSGRYSSTALVSADRAYESRIDLSDAAILANPYLVYEDDRLQADPVAFEIVDRGIFPPESILRHFRYPSPALCAKPSISGGSARQCF